jgi:hypothetical protein
MKNNHPKIAGKTAAAAAMLPRPLRVFWILNVFLTGTCAAIMATNRFLLHKGPPYRSPFIPFQHWIDLLLFAPRFQHFHQLDFFSEAPSSSFRFMYPAPVALLYEGFYFFHWHTVWIFFAVTGSLVLALGAILGRQMVRRGVHPWTIVLFLSSALLFSYPFWFEYLLGNMEVCIFLIVAFAIIAFMRGHMILSATLIGVAASMKLFPFVYLALFLSRRRYKAFAWGIATAVITNIVSLWLVCPSLPIAYRGVHAGLAAFELQYILPFLPMETGFDHSIFGFIKALIAFLYGPKVMPPHLLTGYLVLASAGGLALYFFRIRFLPILNQILCLCVASILLPPASHDYTLLQLYVPWSLLALYAIDQAKANRTVQGLYSVFVCFAILLSAESELIYKAARNSYPHGYSGQLKAITLVVLLLIGLNRPFEFRTPEEAGA